MSEVFHFKWVNNKNKIKKKNKYSEHLYYQVLCMSWYLAAKKRALDREQPLTGL